MAIQSPYKTITSANSVITLFAPQYSPLPLIVGGAATDEWVGIDPQAQAEVMKGVDGRMSAGWLPSITQTTIKLQADSDSLAWMRGLLTAQTANREILWLTTGTIMIPGVNESYVLSKGVIENGGIIPGIGKVLSPLVYTIKWDRVVSSIL